AATFHARFQARSKTYRYRIWTDDVMSPFERRYAWHVPGAFDLDGMAAAAQMLEGRHDFAAFHASGSATKTTAREIFHCAIRASQSAMINYEIRGDGFLRHMVRAIVGTLVERGR